MPTAPAPLPTRDVSRPPVDANRATPAETVPVRLAGLPSRARVRVDGVSVEPRDGVVQVARDGEAHRIQVAAPGGRVWSVSHEADRAGAYRVRLRAARRGSGGGSSESPEAGGSTNEAGMFTDLDY